MPLTQLNLYRTRLFTELFKKSQQPCCLCIRHHALQEVVNTVFLAPKTKFCSLKTFLLLEEENPMHSAAPLKWFNNQGMCLSPFYQWGNQSKTTSATISLQQRESELHQLLFGYL